MPRRVFTREPTLDHLRLSLRVSEALADHAMLPRLRNEELRKMAALRIQIAAKEAE